MRRALLCLALSSLVCLGYASVASGAHVQCGAVITQDTTLDSDLLNCPPPYAISVDGPGVTLDLGGHTVDGTTTDTGTPISIGIRTHRDRSVGVQVINGRVQEFRYGIYLDEGGDQVVRNVTVTDNGTGVDISFSSGALIERVTATRNVLNAISLDYVSDPVVRRNRVFANAGGIGGASVANGTIQANRIHDNDFGGMGLTTFEDGRIVNNQIVRNGSYGLFLDDASANNVVRSNDVVRNGADGILSGLGPTANRFVNNRANGNGDDGIDIDWETAPGEANTLTGNTANRNGDLGIEAAEGTIDGGGNRARHNGNPAQCVGVTCN